MADHDSRPPVRGDEGDLFRGYNDEPLQTVARAVRASSPQIIEDACAFAWATFLENQPDRDRNWKAWLFRVAQRESWRLEREHSRDIPTRDGEYAPHERLVIDRHDHYEIRDELDDAFSVVARLPARLRRIAVLRALGMRAKEIGELTGDSQARVSQLIARANAEVYEVLAERAHHAEPGSPRAERLWQLEHDQPDWLTERIGRLPRSKRNSLSSSTRRLAWRRAALALDDYRQTVGAARFHALDGPSDDPGERRAFEAAKRAIDELAHARGRSIGRGLGD
jgi:RNA polymerase sigma factor (sigma-70 family)